MTLVSHKFENSPLGGVHKFELSDGTSLLFVADYLFDEFNPALWNEGRELNKTEEEAFRFAAVCFRVEKIALRLIARAEQYSLGLLVKLERRGFDALVAKAVISRLLDQKLLDDSRYAECWIRSRLNQKQAPSPRWLLVSLGKKGIDKYSSGKALKTVLDEETEYSLLSRTLSKAKYHTEKKTAFLRARFKYEGFSLTVLNRFFEQS